MSLRAPRPVGVLCAVLAAAAAAVLPTAAHAATVDPTIPAPTNLTTSPLPTPAGSDGCGSDSIGFIGATTSEYGVSDITLRAVLPSGEGNVSAAFHVWDADGSKTVDVTAGPVPPGSTAGANIGLQVQDGHTYHWYATTETSSASSSPSETCSFTVDSRPPNAQISSSDWPQDGTSGAPTKAAGQAGTFTLSGSDPLPAGCTGATAADCASSGLSGFCYSLDQPPSVNCAVLPADSAGRATVTLSPGWGTHTLYVAAVDGAGNSGQASYTFYVPWKLFSSLTPTGPTRVLDTRLGLGAPQAKVAAGQTLRLKVPGIPSYATAVAMNLTVTGPTKPGFVTAYPDGSALPTASSVNFAAGETISNLVVVPVTDGAVDLFNHAGSVDLVADLTGYYTAGTGSTLTAVGPTRVLDTRSGLGAPAAKVGAGQTLKLTVPGLPSSGVTAVVLNLTVIDPTKPGFVTAYPDGSALPTASSVNFAAGQTIPNLVVVPVTDGRVDLYNHSGSVDLAADLAGYYTTGSGLTLVAVAPDRLLDTRNGTAVGPGQTVKLDISGSSDVAESTKAILVNVTVTAPTASSFITAYPDGSTRPVTSNLNFGAGETVSNMVVVPVNNGVADFYNHSGSVEVIGDIAGYFTS